MKRMTTKDYHEMLHFAPQRSNESRFARDYRAHQARAVATKATALQILKDGAEVLAMGACFLLVVYVCAVFS